MWRAWALTTACASGTGRTPCPRPRRATRRASPTTGATFAPDGRPVLLDRPRRVPQHLGRVWVEPRAEDRRRRDGGVRHRGRREPGRKPLRHRSAGRSHRGPADLGARPPDAAPGPRGGGPGAGVLRRRRAPGVGGERRQPAHVGPPSGSARVLRKRGSFLFAADLSADGARAAAIGEEGIVYVYDVATGDQLAELRGHDGAGEAVDLSPDGRRVVSGGADRSVRVWDVATGEATVLRGHASGVVTAAFGADGTRVISAADDGVRVWDWAQGTTVLEIPAPARDAFRAASARTAAASPSTTIDAAHPHVPLRDVRLDRRRARPRAGTRDPGAVAGGAGGLLGGGEPLRRRSAVLRKDRTTGGPAWRNGLNGSARCKRRNSGSSPLSSWKRSRLIRPSART